jgi:hypothetical protein
MRHQPAILLPPNLLLRPHVHGTGSAMGFGIAQVVIAVVVWGLIYGAVMGTSGGFAGERLLQPVYSAIKVPLLLLITFSLGLPSFFVLNTLLGVRNDFAEALRALMLTQAALTVILASLAPFTAMWYLSFENHNAAVLFNGLMFAIASLSSHIVLRRLYQPLIARNPRHKLLLRLWLTMYVFVGIQMGWVLRPFVGNPGLPTQFLREDSWSNAYVAIARIISNLVQGH